MVADTVEVGQVEAMYSVDLDPDLEVNGWLEYKARAIDARDRFEHHLQALLDQYGVQDESQLVSGRMISVRNRVSDGEKEDFSFYNTEKIVELRISKIFDKFRRHFFEEFGGEREDLLESPPLTAQQKASAYYMVTYAKPDVNNSERRGRMLSFPWLVWEILAYVKQHKFYEKGIPEEFIEPVHVKLAKAAELYNRLPETEKHRLQLIRQALKGAPNLKLPLLAYGEDLGKLLYVILRWCEKERVTGDDRRLRIEHIAMLFIMYASGLSGYVDKTGHVSQYVLPMDQLKGMYESSRDDFRCSKKLYRPGALCLEFIKYLASQYFRCQKELDFRPHGINSVFSNREWLHLHSVAFKTYHHIAWTLNFRSLHMDDPNLAQYSTLKWDRDELDPIPIRLSMDALFFSRFPSNNQAALDNSSRLLKIWSGMDEVSMRFDVANRDPNQFLVVGIGSLEARNRLKEILLCDELEDALYLEVCPESKRDF